MVDGERMGQWVKFGRPHIIFLQNVKCYDFWHDIDKACVSPRSSPLHLHYFPWKRFFIFFILMRPSELTVIISTRDKEFVASLRYAVNPNTSVQKKPCECLNFYPAINFQTDILPDPSGHVHLDLSWVHSSTRYTLGEFDKHNFHAIVKCSSNVFLNMFYECK